MVGTWRSPWLMEMETTGEGVMQDPELGYFWFSRVNTFPSQVQQLQAPKDAQGCPGLMLRWAWTPL